MLYPSDRSSTPLLGRVRSGTKASDQIDVHLDVADDPPPDTAVSCIAIVEKHNRELCGLVLKESHERVGCFFDVPKEFFHRSKGESITIKQTEPDRMAYCGYSSMNYNLEDFALYLIVLIGRQLSL